jgi:uncharacterized protein (TIGR00255 family)
MITSMTGFGSSEKTTESYSLRVEIKTLNSKYFDPSLKIPKEFTQWEFEIKSILEKGLVRGKVNLLIDFQVKKADEPPIIINDALFQAYYKKYSEMAFKVDSTTTELFKLALHSPQVMVPEEDPEKLINWEDLKSTVEAAVKNCVDFRADEGKKLLKALEEARNNIQQGLTEVQNLDPFRIQNIRARIETSLNEIKDRISIDSNRFEQELIYYIEKIDITEEKVRLQSHLDYMAEIMAEDASNGKKLGFLSQELGREINTIGSKANDAGIQRSVVKMKEELEKIKEQVLNVL